MARSAPVAILLAALTLATGKGPEGRFADAQRPDPSRRVVVILVDRTDPTVLGTSTGIQSVVARGAAGLMTTTTADADDANVSMAAAATLSAGEPALGPTEGGSPRSVQAGMPDEDTEAGPLGDLFRARTGQEPDGAVVYPDIGLLARLNESAIVGASPGLLGEALRRAGLPAAAVGTSDLPGDPLRLAPILAMDGSGRVTFGSTDTDAAAGEGQGEGAGQPPEPVPDVLPVGVDLDALQTQTESALHEAQLVVVEWGDPSRIDRLLMSEARRLSERDPSGLTLRDRLLDARQASMRRLDEFLRFLDDNLVVTRDIVMLLSPTPPAVTGPRDLSLAPIAVSGGGLAHGSLTSDTTHRLGLVSNVDVAPTILEWLGVPVPPEMPGHRLEVVSEELPLRTATDELSELAVTTRQRDPLLLAGLALWVLAVAAGGVAVETRLRTLEGALAQEAGRKRRRGGPRAPARAPAEERATLVRALMFAAAVEPLIMLLKSLVAAGSTAVAVIVVTVSALLLGLVWAAAGHRRTATGLGAVGGVTLALLVLDRLFGGPLSSSSVLGVEAWEGPDFHGLGSILVGVAIAGALLAAWALARRFRRQATWARVSRAGTGVALLLLALPTFGDSPAPAIAGLPALLAQPRPRDRRARQIWWIAVAAIVVVIGAVATLAVVSEVAEARPSPLTGQMGPAGPAAAASIVVHELGEWARLLFASVWTAAIALGVAVVIYLWMRLRGTPLVHAPRGRALPPPDRFVQATLLSLGVAAAITLLISGPATAGVILMTAALLMVGASLDRVRALRRP